MCPFTHFTMTKDCNLEALPDSLLCDSPYIQVINISHNLLRSARLTANVNVNIDNSDGSLFKCNNKAEQLIIFDLSYNRIRSIGDNDLIQLVAIRQLLLANNQINVINRNALKACALLQQLHIGNNSIEELPVMPETLIHLDVAWNRLSIIPATIANLPNLLFLNLSGNAIDANTPFSVISSTLRTADLSRNRFEFIPENLFAGSSQQLQHFLFSYNRITQLESLFFQNYSNLLTLDLGSNRIAEIEEDSLVGLVNLTHLYLLNNSIYQVDMGTFEATPQLQELHLGKIY
ncbi:Leucine-rich repeats and immunoglobulin-like domains protein 1 [Dirofilaria immitis]|nr:Leucine-rich repeats and immunoglobulin-like domains protein 1 [Dirofilaria immitis]